MTENMRKWSLITMSSPRDGAIVVEACRIHESPISAIFHYWVSMTINSISYSRRAIYSLFHMPPWWRGWLPSIRHGRLPSSHRCRTSARVWKWLSIDDEQRRNYSVSISSVTSRWRPITPALVLTPHALLKIPQVTRLADRILKNSYDSTGHYRQIFHRRAFYARLHAKSNIVPASYQPHGVIATSMTKTALFRMYQAYSSARPEWCMKEQNENRMGYAWCFLIFSPLAWPSLLIREPSAQSNVKTPGRRLDISPCRTVKSSRWWCRYPNRRTSAVAISSISRRWWRRSDDARAGDTRKPKWLLYQYHLR